MTWGLNLGLNNVTNAVNMAKSIINAFKTSAVKNSGVTLAMLELGTLMRHLASWCSPCGSWWFLMLGWNVWNRQ